MVKHWKKEFCLFYLQFWYFHWPHAAARLPLRMEGNRLTVQAAQGPTANR